MLIISFFSKLLLLLKDIFGFLTNLQSFALGWGMRRWISQME